MGTLFMTMRVILRHFPPHRQYIERVPVSSDPNSKVVELRN